MYSVATSNGTPINLFTTLFDASNYACEQFNKVWELSGYKGVIYFYASYQVPNAMAA